MNNGMIDTEKFEELIAYIDDYITNVSDVITTTNQLSEQCSEIMQGDVIGEETEYKLGLCVDILKRSIDAAEDVRDKTQKKLNDIVQICGKY
jgi:hypothetical protein